MSPTETSDEQSTVAAKSWRYPAALVTAGLLLVVTGAAYFYWSVSRPLIYKSGRIAVHQGDSLTTVARQLQANGIISNVYCFIALAYVRGQTKSIKAGEYELPPELSIGGLLDQLISGRVVEYPLALIEGWTFPQILDLLRLSPKIRHTLSGLSPDQIMERLGHPDMHPEGRFFPDTYLYMAGTTDLSILSRAFERMQNQLEQKWATRSAGLPIKTPEEAL
ncbi:MAG: endolytic transglycosylase MltG, partial [Gammaproteobacteria bacterium]|nr:endolytic transglycosylase MltG [Gammaproteobacteria bacterium]